MERYENQFSAVYGEYRRGADRVTFIGFNIKPGSGYLDELEESPKAEVRNALAGSGATSPEFVESGDSDVVMACEELRIIVVCAWADATAIGSANWVAPELDLDRAAKLTRQFRPHVSYPTN